MYWRISETTELGDDGVIFPPSLKIVPPRPSTLEVDRSLLVSSYQPAILFLRETLNSLSMAFFEWMAVPNSRWMASNSTPLTLGRLGWERNVVLTGSC